MPGGNTAPEAWIWSIGETHHGAAGHINDETGDTVKFGDFEFFWLIEGVLSHPSPLRYRQRDTPQRTDSMPPDKPLIATETATSNTQLCGRCGVHLEGDHSHVHEFGSPFCKQCLDRYVSELAADARGYAEQEVRLIGDLPASESEHQLYRVSEDYQPPCGPTKIPDAYLARCRREASNCDDLLSRFNSWPSAIAAQTYRQAILDRADELIIQMIHARPSKAGYGFRDDREQNSPSH